MSDFEPILTERLAIRKLDMADAEEFSRLSFATGGV